MFSTFKDKAQNLATSAKELASDTTDSIKAKKDSAAKTIEESGLSDSFRSKLSGINTSVIQEWTKDSDAPDKRTLTDKLKNSAKVVGKELYVLVVQSYFSMVDNKTDPTSKAVLAAGLAYFILPVDLIPDFMAGVGFTDDAAALALTAKTVSDAITEEHATQAGSSWNSFIGESVNEEEPLVAISDLSDIHVEDKSQEGLPSKTLQE